MPVLFSGRINEELNIKPGETSADGKVSLLNARCLGACSMAPAVVVDGAMQGRVTPRRHKCPPRGAEVMTNLAEHDAVPADAGEPVEPIRACADVCEAAGCMSLDAEQVLESLQGRIESRGLTGVAVKRVGCLRLCAAGPLVEIPESGQLFEKVDPSSEESIDRFIDALAEGAKTGSLVADNPFFSRQTRIVLANSGVVDPEDLDDYIAHGGYKALTQAVTTLKPLEVLEEVVNSGLRGRGGAGYPTGLKWRTVAKSVGPDENKYVI